MSGLFLLVMAELADVLSSLASELSGRGVEANPIMPHDIPTFLAVKALVCVLAMIGWLVAGRLRPEVNAAYLVCSGALLVISFHNLGIAQRFA